MFARSILVSILLTCCAGGQLAQVADLSATSDREADERITSVDDRRHAITTLQAQAGELRKAGRPIEAARTLNRVGRFQIRLFLKSEAVATFQEALRLLEQTPDVETRIESLNGIGDAYRGLSDCARAQVTLNESLTLSRQNASKAGEAEALLTLSECQNYHDHERALGSAREALKLWESLNDKRRIAETHTAIGAYEMAHNELIESEQDFNAALAIWRELNAMSEQAEVLINLGFVENRKGAWQDSLSFYTEAQTHIDAEAEPYQMGQITAGMAEAFIETGLPEIGLAKFRDALAYYRQTKNQRAVIAMEWGIGRAQFLAGDYAGALASLEGARGEAEAIQEVMLTAMCNDFLGRTYNALNRLPEALAHLAAAFDGYTRAKNPLEIARTRALMGAIYESQGNVAGARRQYQTALDGFRALSDRVNESAALYALGRLELQQNNLDEAENYLKQSIDLTENVRRISTSRDLTAAFSATIHDRYQTYVECLMRKHHDNRNPALSIRAFEVSDSARARSLAEMLRATGTNLISSFDPEMAVREMSLRQSLRVKEDARVALLSTNYSKADLEALNRELAALESEYKQLTEYIRARYPAYERITRPNFLTLAEIQAQVLGDDQTILLEYSLGTNQSYLWAVTRTQISAYELPGRAEIERQALHLYSLLSVGDPNGSTQVEQRGRSEEDLAAATAALSQTLLAPVAGQLGTKRLLIVADGALQYIPFQILTPPGNRMSGLSGLPSSGYPRPLMLDHDIINEPSAAILALAFNLSANSPARGSVAVLADPVFQSDDPRITSRATSSTPAISSKPVTSVFRGAGPVHEGMPRLLGSRDEAAAIISIVPWQTGFEAVDFDASRATVNAAQLDHYNIVHFATHAFIDEKSPESSGIVLSLFDRKGAPQEGFLRLNDIYNLRMPVNLVVLSACQTGLGKDVRGEGLIGLTRGFMYAGASAVMASLWKVDDEATSELMKRFYRGMFQDNLAPAAALRQAQTAMWQERRWHSPYYWGAFVIQGRYDQTQNFSPAAPVAQKSVIAAGLVSTFVLMAFLFLGRRRSARV